MKKSGLKEDSLRFGNTGYWTEGQEGGQTQRPLRG